MEKYYAFYFFGKGFDRKLFETYLPVGQVDLEFLLSQAENSSRSVIFKVIFGLIKELTMHNGEVVINSPSTVGDKKYQAFIFKRESDQIIGDFNDFFINGSRIDFNFESYNVNVIEVND